ITVHRVFSPPHYLARYITVLEVARLMRKIRPDIIHAHFVSHFGIVAALYSLIWRFRPIVLTAWGAYTLRTARLFKRRLIRFALRRADGITCDGDNMVELLVGMGADPQKINLIYFGTDIQKFSPSNKNGTLKQKLGIAGSSTVVSLRVLKPLYDIESLVRSIPLVLKEVPEVKFIIAGDGEQRKYLEDLAEVLGVATSVRFVGMIANDELPQYLTSSDVYVSTSLSDAGIAASTAEAMACELPVVVTDFGDNRKWVEDDINGFIVPPKNPETLAAKITYLLQHEDKRRDFGRTNREVIMEKNNWEKEMGKVEKLYNQLIERCR
ncbi:glycosyltransferase, partial [Chloroflexota bacterium]